MHLDTFTFMVSNTLITAFACLCLFGAWVQFNRLPALLWWACAHGANAIGLTMLVMGFALRNPVLPAIAGIPLTLAPAMIWAGVERFHGRHVPLPALVAGLAVLLAVAVAPFDIDHRKWSVVVQFGAWTVYLLLAAASLWSNREEKLQGQRALMVILSLHAVIFLGGCQELLTGTFEGTGPPDLLSWFGMIHFESIFYAGGTAVVVILMTRDRREQKILEAAKTDSLTGAVNRQAFFEGAERLLERCRKDGSPYSMVMFDLDHFKNINDTQGHQAGDRILVYFANTVQKTLRPNDLFGRYGGEEFLVVLPEASVETAYVIAERVRKAFADDHRFFDGSPLNATVSAGVASITTSCDLNEIVALVDQAMYAAKHNGRNRVECATNHDTAGPCHNIVKIA
ncbi:GGDEF domain-containing protein [Roseibium aggregatum]|uniref:diguanylate cyclase n=1 Tax=Roseibium aggregatum TaxID=187304 RepID=A0A926NNU2_9HYPH|nr:GGDEF domain-containing protein [Roseibium aggregatum]MBD1544632.1 GGDEF domain-containing protein [Roseibium aggregatum]